MDSISEKNTAPGRMRMGPLAIEPIPSAGLEWWFLQGQIVGSQGTRLRIMLAFFLTRGLTPQAREGALMLSHVIHENDQTIHAQSLVSEDALAFQEDIAARVARHHITSFVPGMRGLGLRQHRRDLRALMARVPWYQAQAKGPRISRAPFAASWNGVLLGHDHTRNALRLTLPVGKGRGLEADIALPSAVMDMASDQLDPRFGPGFWYQCAPRLPLSGRIGGEELQGEIWLDRQWGAFDGWMVQSAGKPPRPDREMRLLGWDWFGLSLADGRDIMLNRHFDAATGHDHAAFAVMFGADGGPAHSLPQGFSAHPVRHWQSKMTGARYPVEWQIDVPDAGLKLHAAPLCDDQELPYPGGTALWEGAMTVSGTDHLGAQITGRARAELVGYGAVLSLKERLRRRIVSKV